MKLNLSILIFCSVMMIFSCTKEGPVGPQGEQGIQGPQGPQGIPGNGVARFSYTVPLSSFSRWSSTNEWWYYQNIGTSIGINDAVLVFVYEDHAGVNEYMALPMLSYWNTGNCFNAFNYSVSSNNRVQFTIRNSCGTNPYSNMNTGTLSYRVFVIKSSGREVLESVDKADYQAVATAFGYED